MMWKLETVENRNHYMKDFKNKIGIMQQTY